MASVTLPSLTQVYTQDGKTKYIISNSIVIPQYYIFYNYNGIQAYITKEQLLQDNDEAAALELWNSLPKFIRSNDGEFIKLGGKAYYNIE